MTAFQVIGWYPNIDPRNRASTNISDGALFSTRELAKQYIADHRMYARIKELDGCDPNEVDFHLRLQETK